MKLAAILTLATLAFAGCVQGPDDVQSASADPSDAPEPANAVAEAKRVETVQARVVPIELSGSTSDSVYSCAMASCNEIDPGRSGESWFPFDLKGTLDATDLTLTWDAQTPATEELILGITYEKEDGSYDFVYASGASPLTLAENALGIEGSSVQGVYVNAYRCNGVGPGFACMAAAQEFTIAGSLTTLEW